MNKFIISKRQETYILRLNDILYMEKNLRKIKVYIDGEFYPEQSCIEFYGKFPDVMSHLDRRFMHCHRSYVINMDKIVVMSHNTIFMEKNLKVYMGRNTYSKAKEILGRYLAKKFG